MSVRDEIAEMLRWELSEDPAVQKLFKSTEETVYLTDEEQFPMVFHYCACLRRATLRLADEVDALKLNTTS